MRLEPNTSDQNQNAPKDNDTVDVNKFTTVTGRRDPLTGRTKPTPITTHNKYTTLTDDSESDDDERVEGDADASAFSAAFAADDARRLRAGISQRNRRLQMRNAIGAGVPCATSKVCKYQGLYYRSFTRGFARKEGTGRARRFLRASRRRVLRDPRRTAPFVVFQFFGDHDKPFVGFASKWNCRCCANVPTRWGSAANPAPCRPIAIWQCRTSLLAGIATRAPRLDGPSAPGRRDAGVWARWCVSNCEASPNRAPRGPRSSCSCSSRRRATMPASAASSAAPGLIPQSLT